MDLPLVTQKKKKKKVFTLSYPLKIKNRYLRTCFVFTQLVKFQTCFAQRGKGGGGGDPHIKNYGAR